MHRVGACMYNNIIYLVLQAVLAIESHFCPDSAILGIRSIKYDSTVLLTNSDLTFCSLTGLLTTQSTVHGSRSAVCC